MYIKTNFRRIYFSRWIFFPMSFYKHKIEIAEKLISVMNVDFSAFQDVRREVTAPMSCLL
jgi:hypothetical protein